MTPTRTTPRPIRIVPEPAVTVTCAAHGSQCFQMCICPNCGVNVYAVDRAARSGGPVAQTFTPAEWAHHTGRCGR